MQIPGGWAAQQHGGRLMLIISFASWSLACLCTPTSAQRVLPIILARICVGVAQGFLIPSIHTVLSQVRRLQRPSSCALLRFACSAPVPVLAVAMLSSCWPGHGSCTGCRRRWCFGGRQGYLKQQTWRLACVSQTARRPCNWHLSLSSIVCRWGCCTLLFACSQAL
jgi:MFS family permease